MTENDRKAVVNSWNEWDPLKHVIVGRAEGTMVQAPEPAVQLDFPDRGFPLGTFGSLPKEMEDGGLHCATADVYREGTLEDYFPRQVEGF